MFNRFQPSNYDLAIHGNVNCSNHKSSATSSSSQPKIRRGQLSAGGKAPRGWRRHPRAPASASGQGRAAAAASGTALGARAPATCSISNLLQTCGVCAVHPRTPTLPPRPAGLDMQNIFTVWSERKQKRGESESPRARQGLGEAALPVRNPGPCAAEAMLPRERAARHLSSARSSGGLEQKEDAEIS